MNEDIREAAKNHNWEGCKQALLNVLTKAEQFKSATLCLEYFNIYRDRFKDISDSGDWLAVRIAEIQESKLFIVKGKDLPPFPDMDLTYTDAKARGVKWALFHVWSAARFYDNNQVRASNLTNAISSLINIFRIEHPDWIPDCYVSDFIRQLDNREYWVWLWTKLAADLE